MLAMEMSDMLFPIANTLEEVLNALEQYRGCFIKNRHIVQVGSEVYQHASEVFATEDLAPLDAKTMFPTKIESLVGVERQVIQQYLNKDPCSSNEKLQLAIDELAFISCTIIEDLIYLAKERYNWSDKIYDDLSNQNEWTLNIARYPFLDNQAGQILFPAHKDWGLLAIYPFIQGAGLEVFVGPATHWQPVEVPSGTVFCYAGDIFSRLTNGKVPALLHRVVQPEATREKSRTSIIFYADPIREMVLPNGEKVGDIIDSKLKKIGQIK